MGSSPASFIMSESALFLLASGSPRRRALLDSLGLPYDVAANPWQEVPRDGERPRALVRRLALEKALNYCSLHPEESRPVLTADTLVACGRRVLNKPLDEAEAWSFYGLLAGRSHQVLTSVVVVRPDTAWRRHVTVASTVQMVPWDEVVYRRYLDRGEWRDAAGGYRIQEGGAALVRRLRGSWTNVMGLPLAEVYVILRETLRTPRG